MSKSDVSDNWGAISVASANAALALAVRGTIYAIRNQNNGDVYLFLLADLGFGLGLGTRVDQRVRNLVKAILSNKVFSDPQSYTPIVVNRPFSASDLSWSPGGEATIGVTAGLSCAQATAISAWPFFDGGPDTSGAVVNRDYFTGSVIYGTNDIGLSAVAAYQFIGRWFRLWSF